MATSTVSKPLDINDFPIPGNLSGDFHLPDGVFPWYIINRDFLKSFNSTTPVRGLDNSTGLNQKDLSTLTQALHHLKGLRKGLHSKQKDVALSNKIGLISVVSYVLGFLDGKGLGGSGSHITSLAQFQITSGSADILLDQLTASLEDLVTQPATRGGFLDVTVGVTKIVAGGLVVAVIAPIALAAEFLTD